eukprot:CAMPEP_0116568630 /NCGR_PEP_ID=MMETSP0397-20121206/15773_1 /TAXON_ID=216820 /ORGANISM="Cyclophora tenuis, Strain ECT3854" /LENGTH=189 /DNA_ID=CAMNT_0004095961 /DNA_START=347 /DNA_END=916 /DNA_ORIENTATION=+
MERLPLYSPHLRLRYQRYRWALTIDAIICGLWTMAHLIDYQGTSLWVTKAYFVLRRSSSILVLWTVAWGWRPNDDSTSVVGIHHHHRHYRHITMNTMNTTTTTPTSTAALPSVDSIAGGAWEISSPLLLGEMEAGFATTTTNAPATAAASAGTTTTTDAMPAPEAAALVPTIGGGDINQATTTTAVTSG